ncbi:MAG: CopD family protein, partial [Ilumatobacteraceae bacterium]
VSGAFTFSVHSATTPAPGLVDKLLAADHPSSTVEFALGVGRWLSYAGLAVLLGVLGMLAICAPELLRGRRAAWLLGAGCVLGVVGTAWMIAAQSSLQIGHPFRFDAWKAVAETHAGRWWAVRLGLFLVGALLIPLVKRMRIDNVWSVVAIVYAAAMLGTVTAGGHGVTGRWIAAGFLATAVHLAAMSLWVGGLVALVVCVPNRERWPVAAKFSRLAFFSVVVLAFTGVVNAWRQSSSLSALIHSTYGTWLWIKLVVVAGVLVVAWFSRRRARSRGAPQGEGDPAVRIRMFRRLVLSEVLGVAAVLALTAGLVSSAPPRQLALAPESVTVVVGDRIAQVVLAPPVAGGTEMHVYISSVSTSLATPVAMSVTASLASKGITNLPLTMSVAAPGHLTGGDVDLPVAGAWTLTITARYSEFDQSIFTVPVSVR